MPRGRPRKGTTIPEEIEEIFSEEKPKRKFTRIHDGKYTTAVWEYDLDIFDKGPIEVNIKHKKVSENENEVDWDSRIKEIQYRKAPKGGQKGRPKKRKTKK